ncbi:MAG: hypothetical protein J1E16_04330 [Muribaculaceae bacterium]|nr:hypothetical protein [Muribaculaceae bacterium]
MTHEDICTLEQSKELHRLGFDWHCHRLYNTFDVLIGEASPFYSNEGFYNMPLAPTLAQATKWLRDVKGIHITADIYYPKWRERDYTNPKYLYSITLISSGELVKCDVVRGIYYKSYEEALSKGIDRALEILKEEK